MTPRRPDLATSLATAQHTVQLTVVPPSPQSCRECRWAECKFRVARVRSWLIAYREAVKLGDDPAEYIRDSIKPSRRVGEDEGITPTDALIRGTKPTDRLWHIDAKVALEEARAAGLSLDAWNAPAVAEWLCSRAGELPVDQ